MSYWVFFDGNNDLESGPFLNFRESFAKTAWAGKEINDWNGLT